VTTLLRVYQGGDRPLAPVTVAINVIDATGVIAFASSQTLGKESFGSVRAADVGLEVPVAQLAPGPYLLRVEASAGRATAKREVRFAVTRGQLGAPPFSSSRSRPTAASWRVAPGPIRR
jgi:hypothetical protein